MSEDKDQKVDWNEVKYWALVGVVILAALVICALTLAIGFG